MANKGTTIFIIFAVAWEIAVGLLYGWFFFYNETKLTQMQTHTFLYYFANTNGAITTYKANTTQFPFPQIVVAVAIILLIVGLAMVAGYIERQSVTGMAFTLLIFALTVQNFFIFHNFWVNVGVNDKNISSDFSRSRYNNINYINYGNDLKSSYFLQSASFLDAVGAALALYAGYTAVIGRIGLGQIFFLTWIGTFLYELNSQILWRLYIPDNGYPSRAFAFGGALGIVSSIILGKRELTKGNPNYKSSYKTMALAFLGIIFVWCAYPILVLSNVYIKHGGEVVTMAGQVNIWLALAASVLGCYTASSLIYRKFCVHDMIFGSITGAIAYSSSTNINYNPGASTAIGFTIAFICTALSYKLKMRLNTEGVVDSNSVIFHFLIPSFWAAVFSAIMQGVNQSNTSLNTVRAFTVGGVTTIANVTANYSNLRQVSRAALNQGGFQIAGWCISIALGAGAGILIGFIYKFINDSFEEKKTFFSDQFLYQSLNAKEHHHHHHHHHHQDDSNNLPVQSAQNLPAKNGNNKQTL